MKGFLKALLEGIIDILHFWNPHRSGAAGGAIVGFIIVGIVAGTSKLF